MTARNRFILAIGVLALLMTGPFWLTAALLASDLKPDELKVLADVLLPRLPIGIMMTVVGLFIGVYLLRELFRQYVRGLLNMAEQLRLMHGANRSFRIAAAGPPEVRQLAEAANELAQQRDDLLADVEARVDQAKAAVESEKDRLAALVADLPQPVIVCNLDGRILLYNNRARLQARALAPDAQAPGALIGLGRSIYAVFDHALIAHALETLQHHLEREGSQPLAHFVTTSRAGQLIRVQMAPVTASRPRGDGVRPLRPSISGYVLAMENISRYLEHDAQCDLLMQQLADESRGTIAGIRGSLRQVAAAATGDGARQGLDDIESALAQLSGKLNAASNQYAESMKARWPLEEMMAADLLAAAQRRIEARVGIRTRVDEVESNLWVKVDSYSLTQAVAFLAAKIEENYGTKLVRLRCASAGRMVHLDILWAGTAVSTETLFNWQLDPMHLAGESSPLTLRDVTDRHGGQLSCGRERSAQMSLFRFEIPVAVAQEVESVPLLVVESRPEFYDFDLFHRSDEDHAQDDRLLSDLTYTVFDTETTGLQPSNGDEIIQIGAVRIVNGRLLRHESMDQMVDPQRSLNPASIPIHGITPEMLAGQPTIGTVLPQFHAFAADTVLIAHNAAFDMRFLQLKEAATGLRFTQPVVDTLLLSAVVHPNQESHRLEAIAERLGIPIIGRHNALGDAIVTAEVFLLLVALLKDMGIRTLREAREAAEKTYYARIKY
ncbi:MAG: DNA polymerase III subunit epsilon [Gammaproteobacteria bacterium]|nr:DNA polymerase III subunit epsilon [Gammaproteobacteria bacterium]MBU1647518.1 DNA polymerase III subunit epsilon [Gammaproteobacteria bacterium]MBU1972967.1 DNA polymerase III subunit epsilon [Gammaproteobacteria bacterium]